MLGRVVVVGVYGGGERSKPALPKGVEYPDPACVRTVRARQAAAAAARAGAVRGSGGTRLLPGVDPGLNCNATCPKGRNP